MECEGLILKGFSPALRVVASDFSLRGQRKVINRVVTPANPTAAAAPSSLIMPLVLCLPLGGLDEELISCPSDLWGEYCCSSGRRELWVS